MMFLAVYMFKIKNLHIKSEPEKARYHLGCIYTIYQSLLCNGLPFAQHMLDVTRASNQLVSSIIK